MPSARHGTLSEPPPTSLLNPNTIRTLPNPCPYPGPSSTRPCPPSRGLSPPPLPAPTPPKGSSLTSLFPTPNPCPYPSPCSTPPHHPPRGLPPHQLIPGAPRVTLHTSNRVHQPQVPAGMAYDLLQPLRTSRRILFILHAIVPRSTTTAGSVTRRHPLYRCCCACSGVGEDHDGVEPHLGAQGAGEGLEHRHLVTVALGAVKPGVKQTVKRGRSGRGAAGGKSRGTATSSTSGHKAGCCGRLAHVDASVGGSREMQTGQLRQSAPHPALSCMYNRPAGGQPPPQGCRHPVKLTGQHR
jgi:hypothetical protein